MTLEQFQNIIAELAKSQGFYWRLQNALTEHGKWEELLAVINSKGITDPVDLVLFLEQE